jgi:hypothetical protein
MYRVGYQWVIPYNLALFGPLSLRNDVAVNTAPFSNSSLHSYSSEIKIEHILLHAHSQSLELSKLIMFVHVETNI